ncbi:MAG TPA: GNAT family N-acetyltransferase [Longimicrobium sp.]|nr:GNAT family N-acetyltransferase [Longimicrobium sp.]
MNSDDEMPPGVEVLHAAAEEAPILANLLELYAHDFSEFVDIQLQPGGRFGYSNLSRYWAEEGRFPFLVKVDGNLAGFVLVAKGSRINADPSVWDVAEFFVVRGHRKRGIGAAVAHEIWRRFPGRWEVRVMESNPAAAFWARAVEGFTHSGAEEHSYELHERRWRVFSFVSPATAGAQ